MNNNQNEAFFAFIEEARQSTTNYKRFQLSETIPPRLADAIKEIIGIDVSGYKNEIYEQIIRHIETRHGEQGIADHSMKDINKLEDTEQVPDDFKSPGHTPKTQPTNNVSSD